MTIHQPHLCTRVHIFAPRYSDKHGELAEPVVLIAKYKVHHASPVIIIEFTKAKHLIGGRFAIRRAVAEKCALDSNGRIVCYAVPMGLLEPWESAQEVRDTAFEIFPG